MDLGAKNGEKQYEKGRNIKTFVEVEVEEEEEQDLFEINLEVVNKIPPPQYYWDSYSTATSDTLLANCLLPISDVSRAIPMVLKAYDVLTCPGAAESMPRKHMEGNFVLQCRQMKA
ncbi:unnamed protein product [Fraxinus pennsylvanica]|uniref:Uncharacterized protein n=1 Tax=Fraxinus pennsylvanica TaxID=56036 RepID=A0AAD1ZE46_9LAMI|nr:unnamed protein product [Fraxinus pennsylvanica]